MFAIATSVSVTLTLIVTVASAQLTITQPTTDHWCAYPSYSKSFTTRLTDRFASLLVTGVKDIVNTLAWRTGSGAPSAPSQFSVFLTNPNTALLVSLPLVLGCLRS